MTKRSDGGKYTKGSVPANKIVLPKDELIELSKIYGSPTIAKHFGVSKQTVLRNMDEYEIEKRGMPKKLPEYWRKALQKPKSVPAWSKGLTKENDARVMQISESLKGDKNYMWKPELHTGEMVECACGCGEMINKYDKRGCRRHWSVGHCNTGHFNKGNKPWNKGKPWDPETLRKILTRKTPNKEEKFLINFFSEHELPYKFVGDGKVIIENRNPDFINSNGQKKIIEFFGEHWHVPEDEDIKREIYKRHGYEMLVIWGKDTKNHDTLLNMVNKFDGGEM